MVRTVSRVGRSVGAAVTGSRPLGDYELVPLVAGGLLLVALAALVYLYPAVFMWPTAVVAVWTGLSLLREALSVWRERTGR